MAIEDASKWLLLEVEQNIVAFSESFWIHVNISIL